MAHSRENIPSEIYVPHPHYSDLFCPDPDLGLTPERSPSHVSNKKSVRFVSPAKCRAKRKMLLSEKENIGFASIELPPEPKEHSTGQRSGAKTSQSMSYRKHRHNKVSAERDTGSTECDDVTSEENHLETPELHTTLHLGRDILQLQKMNIDLVEAVKHRLTVSEQDRANVKQKTFARLNERPKSPGVFGDVTVSLAVPADSVIGQTERQLSKTIKPLQQRQKPAAEKPSILKLFRPELAYHRCVSLDQHGYRPRALHLNLPNIEQAAFEHHDRITLWELK